MSSLTSRILSLGLILACLGACNGPRHTVHPDHPVERFWEPLLQNCSKTVTHVTCDILVFKKAVNQAHQCWEKSRSLFIDRQECEENKQVDRRELEAKVFTLKEKLSDWWRLPLVWAGIGILAGFGIGFGIHGL